MKTVHVLIFSDNKDYVARLRELLDTEKGAPLRFHVESEEDLQSVLRSMVVDRYDVFLVDQLIPQSRKSGVEFIQEAVAGGCSSPTILLTVMSDEDVDWALKDCGASGRINMLLDVDMRNVRNIIMSSIRYNDEVTALSSEVRDVSARIARLLRAFERRR
jgi:hypothetical protein